jgi:N,N'-diacetyllegionaminate synthase
MSGLQFIAEFCQNHNGSSEVLARMIDAAAKVGASHAKVQHIYAANLAYRPQFEEGLAADGVTYAIKRPYRAEFERLSHLELSEQDCRSFVRRCRDAGLIPMTTCFNRSAAEEIGDLGFEEVKVASYDCASFPMLRELRTLFKRLIVSTGATYDDELSLAAKILQGHEFALLHCVTIYPTPLDVTNLARLSLLRRLSPAVGFSDHSLVEREAMWPAKIAVHCGAQIVERHFTILGPTETRDGPVSVGPQHVGDLLAFSRMSAEDQKQALDAGCPNWRSAIGSETRVMSEAELLNRDYYRGRFASRRKGCREGRNMIFNWEETPLQS